jgi:hypothetical protein
MLMKPRLQTRGPTGPFLAFSRSSEGHSAIARFDSPSASSLLARTFVRRQTVDSMRTQTAARAAVGVSAA